MEGECPVVGLDAGAAVQSRSVAPGAASIVLSSRC